MKKKLFLKVWILLIVITVITALVSNSALVKPIAVTVILVLSAIKFLGVCFYFIELRKAHIFWKFSIVLFLFFITGGLILILK